MAESERMIEDSDEAVPEIDMTLTSVLLASLDEARKKLEAGEEVVAFTSLAVKDKLIMEQMDGESAEEVYAYARHNVQHVRGADAYALCYDGYLDTDQGEKDALIAEGGVPGADWGYAVGIVYESDDEGNVTSIADEPIYIGKAPNFMILTNYEVDAPLAEEGEEEDAEAEAEETAADEEASPEGLTEDK
ncbi:MAG: hypothetical protein LIV29_06345 [Denitrobacterium sp.]|jgi:hypothetical protein|nr:hypothetical protein [Denitrobacterium sp.]MCI1480023.1 hypothetical protein [Eggerthellaceae bacterium]